jgi:hypothetical protein
MCGRKRKSSDLEKNWMGLYRCPEHNEPRQPQDFVRNVPDIMTVPWGQPQEVQFVPGQAQFAVSINPSVIVLSLSADTLLSAQNGALLTDAEKKVPRAVGVRICIPAPPENQLQR